MQLSHTRPILSASFDDPNLVSAPGLVPVMRLAEKAGLRRLADERLSVPTDKGANAGLKVASLIGGMVAGADSLDDMGLLRHGGMRKLFTACYAPSTLGSFLRSFTFGHVRQLDAVATRFLSALAGNSMKSRLPGAESSIVRASRALGIAGELSSTGRSCHSFGLESVSEREWRQFMARALLLAPITDERWIAHQLLTGYASLRVSTSDKGEAPVPLGSV